MVLQDGKRGTILRDIITGNAIKYPRKTAVVFGDKKYSYSEFNARVNSLVQAFSSAGLKKGDRLAVLADNCNQFVELWFAGFKSGIVVVPLNTGLKKPELSYIINDCEASVLVLSEKYLPIVDELRPQLSTIDSVLLIGDEREGFYNYEQLLSAYPPDEPEVTLNEDEVACLMYTSGTTGLPKGVMLSHRNLMAHTITQTMVYRFKPDEVSLAVMPLFYNSVTIDTFPHLYVGSTVVVLKTLDPETILQAIGKERATFFIALPFLIIPLLEHPNINKYNHSSLRYIDTGSAPLPGEVFRKARETFGDIFYFTYGQTEATSQLTVRRPEETTEERSRSCGREMPNIEVRVVTEMGEDVAPGEIGEVIARADSIMKGYWRKPEATAQALVEGYLHTGDLATVDEEGYIYIADRKKDIIISGGKTIYSPEVEEVIYSHPAVLEAAVIGVPHHEMGELVRAVVVLKARSQATEKEIIAFCQQKLEDYKCPAAVSFTDKLLRNPSGKVLKNLLREKYSE